MNSFSKENFSPIRMNQRFKSNLHFGQLNYKSIINKKDNDYVRKYIIENYHAPNLADEEFQKNQN